MRTPLSAAERIVLSSSAARSIGKSGDLFPQLEAGELILTNERIIFEHERLDVKTDEIEFPLAHVTEAGAGSIKLFDLVPMYACLELRFTDGRIERIGVVKSGATKPAEWAGAINAARAALSPEQVAAASTITVDAVPGTDAEGATRPKPGTVAAGPDPMPWIISIISLAGAVIEFLLGSHLVALGAFGIFLIYLAVNTGLCLHDRHRLGLGGLQTPETWATLLVPVYLWKRAATLGRTQLPTLVWLACFAASFFIANQNQKTDIVETACGIVTEIIQKQLNGTASCKRLSITEDLGRGFFTGRAVLDNGGELRVTIEQSGREIYVQIVQQ